MPTFELAARFRRDWRKLTDAQRDAFRKTVREAFVPDLNAPEQPFRPGLRVKGVTAHPGIFEMTWAPDGRATFSSGEEHVSGTPHVIWRRIGTHSIFTPPPGP
jgi:WD40-like Beta Propeller Repeat